MVAETRAAAQQQMDARLEKHHQLLEEIARLEKGPDDPALSVPARADRQKQHDDKVHELHALEQEGRELRANQDRKLQELTIRLRNQIVEDILAVVRTQVERRHYDLVLNKSAQGSRSRNVVLYANPDLEISDEVIAALDRAHSDGVQGTPTPSPEP